MRLGFALAFGVWFLAALQESVAPRIAIGAGVPDFLIAFITVASLYCTPMGSAWLGFASGATFGALAGANLTGYAISRMFGGLAATGFNNLGFKPSPVMMMANAAATTTISQILLFFLAPPPDIGRFLAATIISAMYNGVLAMPLYALLNRIQPVPTR